MPNILTSITNTDLFNFPDPYGYHTFGSNQQWYPTIWQQRSGCGPSTGANMFYYLGLTNPDLYKDLYPAQTANDKKQMLALMEDVWGYITPTNKGVNKTEIFSDGAVAYAKSKGVTLTCNVLNVPNLYCRDTSAAGVLNFLNFIQEGVASGCPVAFLNLSNGKVENLHRWHWVTLMSLNEKAGSFFALASDEGQKKEFDMKLWYETSALGGGLVYFTL